MPPRVFVKPGGHWNILKELYRRGDLATAQWCPLDLEVLLGGRQASGQRLDLHEFEGTWRILIGVFYTNRSSREEEYLMVVGGATLMNGPPSNPRAKEWRATNRSLSFTVNPSAGANVPYPRFTADTSIPKLIELIF